jgi:secreted PhoX family phosphatase
VYELKLDKRDPMKADSVTARPLLGALSHEGIETDAEGNVYVIDEDRSGAIYKFVPENYGDLSSGQLYALKVDNGAKTGSATWVALDMTQAQISARVAAKAVGATPFCRPEDLERIRKTLYAALTCEDVTNPANTSGAGAVLSITLGETPVVKYFVAHGVNVGYENKAMSVTGFKSPDNLADGPDGKLWIVEDNVPSDIWVAEPDNDGDGYSDGVSLFASLQDAGAEGTGIYFGKNPRKLFVNVQHSVTGNDKTMVISDSKCKKDDHDD